MKIKAISVAVLSVSVLTAQGASAKKQPMEGFRFGLQGGVVIPTTDSFKYLSDQKPGVAFGGQCTWDVKTAFQRLRARVDVTMFPQASVKSMNGSGRMEDNTIRGISAGLDYIHFLSNKPEGWFLSGGLALANWTQDSSLDGAKTSTNLGIAAGAGWQFNRDFSLEARGTWSRWSTNFRSETIHNAGSFNLEASYRF